MTAKLSATDKNLVLVLLGGEVSHPRSVSALAEKGLVVCGDQLTARGREAAYKVLAECLPSQTKNLRSELLKAGAYAKKGKVAPDDEDRSHWQNKPNENGWHWVEKRPGDRPFMDGPLYLHDGTILPGNGISVPLDGRRVCKIQGPPK